jgi:hypothetical protein
MQERNKYIEVEDFLGDESFQIWVRFNDDQNNWQEWTLEDPKRAKLVAEARLWLLAMKVPQLNLSKRTIKYALESTWQHIEKKENKSKWIKKTTIKFSNYQKYKGVAAVLLLTIFLTWVYNPNIFSIKSSPIYKELITINGEGLVEQTNNTTKSQIITLSDGSSVLLQPSSKLSYPKTFVGNERKVYLSGEAFFEISKNQKKPFFVFANEIVTKVVGTSFRIRAYDNQPDIEVLVRTGKVKIQSNKSIPNSKKEEIVLLPNQALRFVRKNATFNKITDITQDESISQNIGNIEQLSFDFTDTPVSQIFKTIEQAYLVDIDFPESTLKNCHLTTSLNDQPLPQKLKIICKSLGNNSSYEMNGNQIIITSDGCN